MKRMGDILVVVGSVAVITFGLGMKVGSKITNRAEADIFFRRVSQVGVVASIAVHRACADLFLPGRHSQQVIMQVLGRCSQIADATQENVEQVLLGKKNEAEFFSIEGGGDDRSTSTIR